MLTEDFPEDKKLRQELHMKKLVSDTVTKFSDILKFKDLCLMKLAHAKFRDEFIN